MSVFQLEHEHIEQKVYPERKNIPLPDFPASMNWSKPYSRYETVNGCVLSYFEGNTFVSYPYDFDKDHYVLKEFPVKPKRRIGF